jgi:hypothetical protein
MGFGEKMRNVKYPFGPFLVLLSGIIAVTSAAFAVIFLKDEEPVTLQLGSTGIPLPPILLYLILTGLMTFLILVVKIYLYSPSSLKESQGAYTGDVEETVGSFGRWLILLYAFVLAVIVVVPLLALVVPELWWFVCVTGFMSGVAFSELILYFFSLKSR